MSLLHAYFKVLDHWIIFYFISSEFMLWLLILLVFSLCSVILQAHFDGNFFSLFCFSLSLFVIFPAGLADLQLPLVWFWCSQVRIRSCVNPSEPWPHGDVGDITDSVIESAGVRSAAS